MKTLIASSSKGNTNIVSLNEYKCSCIEPKSEHHTADIGNTRYYNQLSRKERPILTSLMLNSFVAL